MTNDAMYDETFDVLERPVHDIEPFSKKAFNGTPFFESPIWMMPKASENSTMTYIPSNYSSDRPFCESDIEPLPKCDCKKQSTTSSGIGSKLNKHAKSFESKQKLSREKEKSSEQAILLREPDFCRRAVEKEAQIVLPCDKQEIIRHKNSGDETTDNEEDSEMIMKSASKSLISDRKRAKPHRFDSGSWICMYCTCCNFPERSSCFGCSRKKANYLVVTHKLESGQEDSGNGWICSMCYNYNFKGRECCNRCEAQRNMCGWDLSKDVSDNCKPKNGIRNIGRLTKPRDSRRRINIDRNLI